MTGNGIFEKCWSGLRVGHSTETSLLKVISDLPLADDSGLLSVLILLGLTAAFDTLDYSILFEHLKNGLASLFTQTTQLY